MTSNDEQSNDGHYCRAFKFQRKKRTIAGYARLAIPSGEQNNMK